MTEQEWLSCTEPGPMLDFLTGKASDRKLRLFAVACCRRIWHLLVDARLREMVKVAENFADGLLSEEAMLAYWLSVVSDPDPPSAYDPNQPTAYDATLCTVYGKSQNVPPGYLPDSPVSWAVVCATSAGRKVAALSSDAEKEKRSQAELVHCIFGNPFHPIAVDPLCRTASVVSLAQEICDSRAFDRLPALAETLEAANCDNAEVLAHCRKPESHVKGCWVLDAMLGKE